MVTFNNISKIKELFIVLDYQDLTDYLQSDQAPFELPDTLASVRGEGFAATANKLLELINSDKEGLKIISGEFGIDLGQPPILTARQLWEKVLKEPTSRHDLKIALRQIKTMALIPKTKKALKDLLIIIDNIDNGQSLLTGGRLSRRSKALFSDKGALAAIERLSSSIGVTDRTKLNALFKVSDDYAYPWNERLARQALPKPGDDADLLEALCKIDQRECEALTKQQKAEADRFAVRQCITPPEPENLPYKKYAVIINGDKDSATAKVHAQNTENALRRLLSKNYTVFVFSAREIKNGKSDRVLFFNANKKEISKQVSKLKEMIKKRDELLIYVTGHGGFDKEKKSPTIVLMNDELSEMEFKQILDSLPGRQQTIIMDQCFGGTFAKSLAADHRLFIANTEERDVGVCKYFADKFWAEQVEDKNGDRKNSLLERLDAAARAQIKVLNNLSFTLSIGKKFVDNGFGEQNVGPPYSPKALEVNDPKTFDRMLQTYKTGITIVNFTAVWCPACKDFAPEFNRLARQFSGKVQFLTVDYDKAPDLRERYKINSVPSVLVFQGETLIAEGREELEKKIHFVLQDATTYNNLDNIKKALDSPSPEVRRRALIILKNKLKREQIIEIGIKFLSDPDKNVRAEAAKLLSKIDYADISSGLKTELLAHLVEALKDQGEQVRHHTGNTIKKLNLTDPGLSLATKHRLIFKLTESIGDAAVSAPIAQALGQLLSSKELSLKDKLDFLKNIIALLENEDKNTRHGAAQALREIALSDMSAESKLLSIDPLIKTLKRDRAESVRSEAVRSLTNFAYSNIPVEDKIKIIDALLGSLGESSRLVRTLLRTALGISASSNVPEELKIKMFRSALKSIKRERGKISRFSLAALAYFLDADLSYEVKLEMLPFLGEALKSDDKRTRELAHIQIASLKQGSSAQQYKNNRGWLQRDEPSVRSVGVFELRLLSEATVSLKTRLDFYEDILTASRDQNAAVRIQVVKTLKRFTESELPEELKKKAFALLVKALEDPNGNVRSHAALTLGVLAKSNIPPTWKSQMLKSLIKLTRDEDGGVQKDARWALNELLGSDIPEELKSEIIRAMTGGRFRPIINRPKP